MKKNENIALLTLGCSKNVVDSEKLLGLLLSNGFNVTNNLKDVDICIINTCGFIKPAVEENLRVLLDVVNLKLQKKIKKVVVFGCLVERFGDELVKEFPEIDLFVGAESFEQIVRFLKKDEELKTNLIGERKLLTPKHYAYLKISEGCNRECSFCAIPKIRGKLRSIPKEQLIEEAKYLANLGVKELIIISQDTSSYGIDLYGSPELVPLLKELTKVEGIEWIRLMYLYPIGIPNGLIEFIAEEPKMCKYLDIPLQHISDKILASMRRGTSQKSIISLIEKIRTLIPSAAIRSTFIVGYPNETEKEFEELLNFVKEFELDRVGVFTYSSEDGTFAYSLGDTIPENEKENRRIELLKLQSNISLRKNKLLIGKTIKVIVDERMNGKLVARTEHDAPEVDNVVHLKIRSGVADVGVFVDAKIHSAKHYDLFGEI